MTIPRTLRIGLIGAGNNMVGAHVPRLIKRSDVAIAAITEPFEANVQRARERFEPLASVPVYAGFRQMLTHEQLDAVVISTPHSFHWEQVSGALQAGLHVLVEKPMVCSVQEAKQVIAERDRAGKIVLVSYQRHYQHAFLAMKKAIDSGLIGQLQYIDLQQNQNWYNNQKRANRWRIQRELSGGGQLNDSGSHIVDIMLYVTSLQPKRVFATQQSFDLEVDVNSAITLEFEGGATGCLSIVGNAPFQGGMVMEDITIYGSEGAIFYRQLGQSDPRQPLIEVRRFDEGVVEVKDVPPPSTPDDNFIAAIQGTEPVYSPAECGLHVMQLSEAAWKSAGSGQPIDVASL
ncbi:MAG: Gfo/Idh/MocA family oxidoreductase [Chloroflexi bacterium]|nr:Gfo/Idh/MocA family oxidoreductase [Chloroflexota bacterium]